MNKPLRIAVADDEKEMREYMREVLPRLGHEVVAVAENGRQLVEQVKATVPDLVIADIKMPDMDGITTSTEVNRERQVPVALVSAHHDAEILTRLGSDHIMGYLVKPFRFEELTEVVRAAARFRESARSRG